MRLRFYAGLAVGLSLMLSCAKPQNQNVWRVEELEIPLYHSSTTDPESGALAHVEYCAAKLSNGSNVLHVVYRPIDFPNRNPGFAKGDKVAVSGIDTAKDFGAIEGTDCWISDIKVSKSADKPDAGEGK